MITVDYLIIGNGIAGVTAAETIRAHDAVARIAIVDREPYPLYSKVLIPDFLKKKITRDHLFLRTVAHYESRKISLYLNAMVTSVDVARNEAQVLLGEENQKNQETFSYKKILIASGGIPQILPATINFGPAIQTLRMQTLADADVIKSALENASTKEAIVMGEGFIAMEFMEVLHTNGFHVHSICRGGLFGERRFGVQGARMLEEYYTRRGIRFYKNIKDEELQHKETWLVEKNKAINVSLAGIGIGLARSMEALVGVEKNIGILTNEYLQTSHVSAWAAGDVAEYYDTTQKQRHVTGNWNSAFMQGRTAALNMIGIKTTFHAVPTYTLINFDLNITFLGNYHNFDTVFELAGTVVDPFLLRVLFKDDTVCGAILINRFKDKTRLATMIEEGANKNDVEQVFQQKT